MQVAPILGGYECGFVSPPPENVQTQCAICLETIRNPYEVSCCGNLFCKTCISREKQENRGCPNCKKHDYDVFHSKSHERCLNQLQVKCEKYTKGCRWMGELGKYDGHQNLTSTELDKRMDGCRYAGLQCRFGCGAVIARNSILKHEVDECPEKNKSDLSEMEERLLLKIHVLMMELEQRDIGKESGSKMDIRRVATSAEMQVASILEGYECEFVSPPPENLQTQCAICLETIRNPYEVSCCGNLFCKTCISREKQENRGCPNCKTDHYDVFHSKSHERCLNQLQVKCEKYTKGCRWMGELGKYDGHQNLTSTALDKRMDGCKYAGLQCRFGCGAVIARNSILKHEVHECLEKNKSDLSEMEVRLLLKIHDLMQELVQRDIDRKESGSKMDIRRVVSNPEAVTVVGHTERKMKMPHAASDPEEIYKVVPTEYTLHSFTEMRNFKRDYVSEPFYTHPEGYKMCLWVHPNGYGTAENTHVSIFTCFLKGKYDRKLKWPFRGNITVLLLNQARDEDHREHTICYDDSNTTYAKRVTTNEKSKGYGVFEAISQESLLDTAYCQYVMDDCLKFRVSKVTMTHKKGLFTSVVSNPEAVTVVGHAERKMKMPLAASDPEEIYKVVPTEYTLHRFTEMRNFKRDYVSEPFYTHPEGYKMCLWVHPNGYGTAENTHVSIFTCFMKGKYDRKLKWPFRGNITVLLLNQARDEDHREHTICYDDSNTTYAKRVTTNEKSKGYGVFEAISQESLMDTAYCQYVMDDCLKFRVSKVTMTPKKGLFRSVFPHNM